MKTVKQLADETMALGALLNDPRFSNSEAQLQIMSALDVLAWVNGKSETPPSQAIVDELNQGLL